MEQRLSMRKDNPVLNTISGFAARASDFFRKNMDDYKREEVLRKNEDDILKAAAALSEAEVEKEKIIELLCKYWKLRPEDARSILVRAIRSTFP